ncbi:MAG: hypothetical protein ACI8RZ_005602 [Myxococcota bacterium]|jgi:hypothetical protein
MLLLIPLAAAQGLPPTIETEIREITWPAVEIYEICWPEVYEITLIDNVRERAFQIYFQDLLGLKMNFNEEIRESVWLFAETGSVLEDSPTNE